MPLVRPSTALGLLAAAALAGLGACASAEGDACLSGLKYDGQLYREQPSVADLPTGASLGAATDERCSEDEPVEVIETTVLELRGVEPSMAVVEAGADGAADTLWVARSVDQANLPDELTPYVRDADAG